MSIPKINDYKKIVGKDDIAEIKEMAKPLKDKHLLHINSSVSGGGVTEMLNSLTLLFNDLGIKTGWRFLVGSHSFFKVTKLFHDSLQGKKISLPKSRLDLYEEYNTRNSLINHIEEHDIVTIHDPQPLAMIKHYKRNDNQFWFWRCHIDLSHPFQPTLNYLGQFIKQYNAAIVSLDRYKIKGLKLPQFIVHPSIDPLSPKNKPMGKKTMEKFLREKEIDLNRPIITQVSRFDPWKDPLGVVKVFKKVRKNKDCQLVLIGDMAADDPTGPKIYQKVMKEKTKDIHLITEKNDRLVNALQRMSDVVLQKSIREGFALTVSEALWKGTPVVGTNVGGIPLQILNGKTGFLVENNREAANRVLQLLKDEELRQKLGRDGREHVRHNFLITKHIDHYLDVYNFCCKSGKKNL